MGLDPSRLKAIPLFEKFSEDELRQIAPFAEEATAGPGNVLVREGDYSYQFVAIEEGAAKVTRDGETVAELGPGDFFGEIGLLETERRTATVVATTPMELIVMFEREFRQMEREMPSVATRVRSAIRARLEANS